MRSHKLSTLGVILLMFLACSLSRSAYAQGGEADVAGIVTDQSGAAMAGVQVTLTNTDTGVIRTVSAQGSGDYRFTAVAPGHYSVGAKAQGFTPESITGLAINLGVHLQENIQLKTRQRTSQTVLAPGEVPLISDYHDTSVGGLIDEKQIQTLPIPNQAVSEPVAAAARHYSGCDAHFLQQRAIRRRRVFLCERLHARWGYEYLG